MPNFEKYNKEYTNQQFRLCDGATAIPQYICQFNNQSGHSVSSNVLV